MNYDLAIIGAGWAGFNAALEARSHGKRVCLVDQGPIGGTCLNRGCIPTKALIQSAKILSLCKKANIFGVAGIEPKIDFGVIQARKTAIVDQLRQSMHGALKGIDFIAGSAQFSSVNTLNVAAGQVKAAAFIIASGSRPMQLSGLPFDGKRIISSDEILALSEIPESLLIIGGGAIGCEFANLFSDFGTRVTIAEKMSQLLPGEDAEVAKKLETIFKKKGILVRTNTDASALAGDDAQYILAAVGRSACIDGLGLDTIGVRIERGKIIVNEFCQTNVMHIFAAGDVTGKMMLAHYAAYQGKIAALNSSRPIEMRKADDTVVPACVFTHPEIAGVGLRRQEAQAKGISVRVDKFDFMASGMARILDEREGFLKIISEVPGGRIIGASVIGPYATELIASLAIMVRNRLTLKNLQETILAHPSISEALGEAAARVEG